MTLAHVAGLPLEKLLLAAPLVVAWWRLARPAATALRRRAGPAR
jgi:hypothetical protein